MVHDYSYIFTISPIICTICDIAGWSNPPGKPTLKLAELLGEKWNPILYYDDISILVNITWSPPHYLGGLNTSDIYYQLNTINYNRYTTNTYSLLYYGKLSLSLHKKALDVSVMVHYNGSMADAMYIPSNIIVKKRYNNLLCHSVGEQTV